MTIWPIIPAAGVGSRMQADRPKQYLTLANGLLIDHTLRLLLDHPACQQVVLALATDDPYWRGSEFSDDARILRVAGGQERCHSVLNALNAILDQAHDDDWALVHDVARPCLHHSDIDALLAAAQQHPQGALLATPTRDTMKRGNSEQCVQHTVEREQLWHALTPQLFPLKALHQALEQCLAQQLTVTDECSAMEHMGWQPRLVEGRSDNIKITRPADLALAEWFLQQREAPCE
ncbi:2-C-methyl-D-erythritol 4-phosphate cytidylyltransferase [Bacterioplanes sanyensis]|uniref:2-C-methyl-D-erythritol 4-phosphate cytidylyltransferase n=1 Tax=Bacterioplanes sanyensis TaxID=1249553 RepID=A0A222FJU6_9GAMM|nr:2-C-methyl-D-erythritol 4-phosphate cytidylyltransferase [Bacterioplanes sanyensis]ASP38764.1 2-C-methyl-D-erythritol 4-phosphate cytidylyltransferase [Bacterioplanes sanyensis]